MKDNTYMNTSRKDQKIARAAAEYAYSNRRWTYEDIFEAYNNPSAAKIRAWHRCQDLCRRMHGTNLIISSRNTMKFSVVFMFPDEETGELCYAYITADYDRFCKASEDAAEVSAAA